MSDQFEIVRITDKYGSIHSSNGAGFDIPVKLLGYYPNSTGKEGWLTQLEFYATGVKKDDAKLRIRWYEWSSKDQKPGKDLTDTNIVVSVLKNGWNTIQIPDKSIFIGEQGIVLGFDMIYPSSVFKLFQEIKDPIESRKFRFQYNWFLGSAITSKKEGFNLYNDIILSESIFNKEKNIQKPALHLYIKTCSQ